ncbi:MAG: PspC domain-containing protein [Actinomycetota bacterium]
MARTAPAMTRPKDKDPTMPRSGGRLVRSTGDRVLTGVAGSIGARLGIDPTLVRLSFAALSLAAGTGVILYVAAYLISVPPRLEDTAAAPALRRTTLQALSVGLMVFGILLLCRSAGLWFGDALVPPTVLAAAGSALIWTRSDEAGRARWSGVVRRLPLGSRASVGGTGPRVRLVLGTLLVLAGVGGFLVTNSGGRHNTALGALAAFVGISVLAGPWFWRLGRQLAEERRERIRSQERADVAAHLHDSVLQTLALIQRTDEPREMASLARAQERELRAWLYGGARSTDHTLLSTAMNDAAAEVERTHRVRIEVVTVGECRLDEPLSAMVLAAREAMINAATHSGAAQISVFVETGPDQVTVFVRDQGSGFEPDAVPDDRRGIADSIEGRIARHRGAVTITTAPGKGTEVRLHVARGDGE